MMVDPLMTNIHNNKLPYDSDEDWPPAPNNQKKDAPMQTEVNELKFISKKSYVLHSLSGIVLGVVYYPIIVTVLSFCRLLVFQRKGTNMDVLFCTTMALVASIPLFVLTKKKYPIFSLYFIWISAIISAGCYFFLLYWNPILWQ